VRMRSHAEHYSADRIGMHEGRARLLAKMQIFAQQSGLGEVARREQKRNSTDLARAYATAGRGREALRLLWRTRGGGWRDGRWWRACAGVVKSLGRARVRTVHRRLRGGRKR
jgi:hypothetical protein